MRNTCYLTTDVFSKASGHSRLFVAQCWGGWSTALCAFSAEQRFRALTPVLSKGHLCSWYLCCEQSRNSLGAATVFQSSLSPYLVVFKTLLAFCTCWANSQMGCHFPELSRFFLTGWSSGQWWPRNSITGEGAELYLHFNVLYLIKCNKGTSLVFLFL